MNTLTLLDYCHLFYIFWYSCWRIYCVRIILFHPIVTPQCVVEIEKKKSNINTLTLLDYELLFYIFWQSCWRIYCVCIIFFYSIVTPQCIVEIEKNKSNINILTLLDYCPLFYTFLTKLLANLLCSHYFVLFNCDTSVCCWNRRKEK